MRVRVEGGPAAVVRSGVLRLLFPCFCLKPFPNGGPFRNIPRGRKDTSRELKVCRGPFVARARQPPADIGPGMRVETEVSTYPTRGSPPWRGSEHRNWKIL